MSSSSAIPSSELGRGRREHIIYMPSQPAALRKIFRTRNRNENSKLHKVFASKNSWLYNFLIVWKKRGSSLVIAYFSNTNLHISVSTIKSILFITTTRLGAHSLVFVKSKSVCERKTEHHNDSPPNDLPPTAAPPPPHHHQGWDVKFNT